MKRRLILLFISLSLITGCENKEEDIKNEYIAMKSQAFNDKNYETNKEIPVEIITSIERTSEEELHYEVTIQEPKENMHNIKAMVVHNYYNEDIYPSIGVFDKPKELLTTEEKPSQLTLEGSIKTTKNLSKLDLELKVWIEYNDDNNKIKDIYYKTT